MQDDSTSNAVLWLKKQALLNARMLKYGLVGFTGIAVNLGTMALLLTTGVGRGWMASAIASVVSTSGNFILHNWWTFSDRQHEGLRLLRGFLSFALISAVGVVITTVLYANFIRVAAHIAILNAHVSRLGIPLICQFAAVLLGAWLSYLLNGAFTWPRTQSKGARDLVSVQEI